ncbi:hypothetical protein K474DRAFT_1589283 [Panus rudis PR-1116 ss-1]|nr:hypothetical protein K474DRAFT_1589283 [Panus rudis PR-1116 ss-1]
MAVYASTTHDSTSDEAVYYRLPRERSDFADGPSDEDLEVEENEEDIVESFVAREAVTGVNSRIRWVHFILGCAVLLPWNVLITASPFFLARLEGSPFKGTFNSYLSTSFTVSNFVFLAHATVSSKQTSNARRGLLSMLWLTLLNFMLTVSTFIHAKPGLFFSFVLLNGIAQAAAGSYLQTAVVAVASLFGPNAMQSVMSGQAAVGVALSAIQVISAASSIRGKAPPASPQSVPSEPEEQSAFAFFGISTVFLLFSAAAHAWLVRLPAYKSLTSQVQHAHAVTGGVGDSAESANLLSGHSALASNSEKRKQILRVAKGNIVYNLAVAYVFLVTLAVFPPITISIQSTNPATHPLLFSAVHFLVFNVGDFFGRYMCSIPRVVIWSAKRLLTLSLARTLFIPLFLMCNLQRPTDLPSTVSNAFISSDILFMLILLLFGLSNGYVSSLCMMSAPSVEHNPRLKGRVEDVDVAATVANFFLIGGLATGSFMSFGVRAVVCNCNPFYDQ